MTPPKHVRIAVAAALVVALAAAGAALSASKVRSSGRGNATPLASGSFVSSGNGHRAFGRHGGPRDGGPLAAAATYLGITQDALRTQLESGKTLAQLADATSGKSKSGLIEALVADARTRIAADVKAGRLTQAQADELIGGLKGHITQLVNGAGPRHGGPGGPGHGPGDDLQAAADYLGLSLSDLQTQLQAGKTLAKIADATSGKSKSGLVAALVAREQGEIAAKVKAGTLTQAQADRMTANLEQRATDLVNGTFGRERGHGHDGPHPPGTPAPSNGTRL